MVDWLASTSCHTSRWAHRAVDAADANKGSRGLGTIPNGLIGAQANGAALSFDAAGFVVSGGVRCRLGSVVLGFEMSGR